MPPKGYTGIGSFIKVSVEITEHALLTATMDVLSEVLEDGKEKNDEFMLAILNAKKALQDVRRFF